MGKKSIQDLSDSCLKGKRVLLRCDFNVPLSDKTITDDTRIRASIPTIKYLQSKGAIITICSHLGRPTNGVDDSLSLQPISDRLGKLLNQSVTFAGDCVSENVAAVVHNAKEGDIIMLENTRFHKEETRNDMDFAQKLSGPFNLFVNDAFGSAHRAHASTEGVTYFLKPSLCGFLLAKELRYLDDAINHGKKPMAAIVGGSKVSSKITVMNSLIDKCDKIIIGGGMVFTFLKAMGLRVGSSLVEEHFVETAKTVLAKAAEMDKKVLLPCDIVIADRFSPDAKIQTVTVTEIPDDWMGLDNGPKTTQQQKELLKDCQTVIMNGPMGVFEFDKFSKGTFALINILADLTKDHGCVTIIGGGDSVAACEQCGRANDMSHISTGGGASLELLEGKDLPGVKALTEN